MKTILAVAAAALALSAGSAFAEGEGNGNPFPYQAPPIAVSTTGAKLIAGTYQDPYQYRAKGQLESAAAMASLPMTGSASMPQSLGAVPADALDTPMQLARAHSTTAIAQGAAAGTHG